MNSVPERISALPLEPPRRPQKLARRVAQQIFASIVDTGATPGSMLPSEREMLEQYGVARATLREALRLLEMQGVVTIRPGPGGGPVVSSPDERPLAASMALLLQRQGASYAALLEAREFLEPALAAMAAERRTDTDVALLIGTVTVMKSNLGGDFAALVADNHRFHTAVANIARNEVAGVVLAALRLISDGIFLASDHDAYPRSRWRRVLGSHVEICDAIAARDGEHAAAAMRSHIAVENVYLARKNPQLLAQPVRWEQVDG